jgi:hypothetical protein
MPLEWLVVRSEHRDLLPRAVARAWRGGAGALADVPFATKPGHPPRSLSFVWPEGCSAQRAARWPDVVAEWIEIYEEKVFPSDLVPVLGEELSLLGAPAMAVRAEDGLAQATMVWYEKGAVAEIEHIGGSQVAWLPETGLGRPYDGSTAQLAGQAGKRLARWFGAGATAGALERMDGVNVAAGATILGLAFYRLLENDPPPVDDIAGMVARAHAFRLAAG